MRRYKSYAKIYLDTNGFYTWEITNSYFTVTSKVATESESNCISSLKVWLENMPVRVEYIKVMTGRKTVEVAEWRMIMIGEEVGA
jgi:hypothetical protein